MPEASTADGIGPQEGQESMLVTLVARQNEDSEGLQDYDVETSSTVSSQTMMATEQMSVRRTNSLSRFSESPVRANEDVNEASSHTASQSLSDTEYPSHRRQSVAEHQDPAQTDTPFDNQRAISGGGRSPLQEDLVGVPGPYGIECPFGNAGTRCAYRDNGASCPFEVPCSLEAYPYGGSDSNGNDDWNDVQGHGYPDGAQEPTAVQALRRSTSSTEYELEHEGLTSFHGSTVYQGPTERIDERAHERAVAPTSQRSRTTSHVSQMSVQDDAEHTGARAQVPDNLQSTSEVGASGYRASRHGGGLRFEGSLNKSSGANAEMKSVSGRHAKRKRSDDHAISGDFQRLGLGDCEDSSNEFSEFSAGTQGTEQVFQGVTRDGWVYERDRSGHYQNLSLDLGDLNHSPDETNAARPKRQCRGKVSDVHSSTKTTGRG